MGQRRVGQRPPVAVGDGQVGGGAGDGDTAAMVKPVVIGTQQHKVGQVGGAAVFPVPDVVGVETAGGPATRNDAGAVAVLQGAAKAPIDHPGRPPRTDDLAGTFEPHFAGGIAAQVTAVSVAQ